MDPINVGLGVAVVGLVFKDRIKDISKTVLKKLKPKNHWDNLSFLISKTMNESDRDHHRTRSELNHIKGQLQEVLQHHKAADTAADAEFQTLLKAVSTKDPLIASIDGDVKAIFQRLDQIAASIPKVDNEAPQIYLQALAGLAKGSDRVIEGQEKIEKLLVQTVTTLNKLT